MALVTDPGILCFQHCNSKIFAFTLPEKCPICNSKFINDSNFGIMPFRLPYPFVRATQAPASVILRPTNGDFLNDYNNQTDLHIAVTTSCGTIVEFDRHGLRRHTSKTLRNSSWEQSLLVEGVTEAWYDHWDEILNKICKQNCWKESDYRKDTHNCYTFVLKFLQSLGYGDLSRMATSRTLFCEKFIVPRTVLAGKYISLYRKIRDNDHYIHTSTKSNNRTSSNSTTSKTGNNNCRFGKNQAVLN